MTVGGLASRTLVPGMCDSAASCGHRARHAVPLHCEWRRSLVCCGLLVLSLLALGFTPGLLFAAKLPMAPLPAGKTFLVIHPHHDDHSWNWGHAGLVTKLADAGWR